MCQHLKTGLMLLLCAAFDSISIAIQQMELVLLPAPENNESKLW
jgi:hypothetical protein